MGNKYFARGFWYRLFRFGGILVVVAMFWHFYFIEKYVTDFSTTIGIDASTSNFNTVQTSIEERRDIVAKLNHELEHENHLEDSLHMLSQPNPKRTNMNQGEIVSIDFQKLVDLNGKYNKNEKECLPCHSSECMRYFSSPEAVVSGKSCGFKILEVNFSETFQREILSQRVPLSVHSHAACLMFLCGKKFLPENKACIISGGLLKGNNYMNINLATGKCLSRNILNPVEKELGDIELWQDELPLLDKPTYIPKLPNLVVTKGPGLIDLYSGSVRSVQFREKYHWIEAMHRETRWDTKEISSSCFQKDPSSQRLQCSWWKNMSGCRYRCYKTVIELNQPYGEAIYHGIVEGVLRVSPLILAGLPTFFKEDVVVHVSSKHNPKTNTPIFQLLKMLGFKDSQIISGTAIGERVIIPTGGKGHSPFQSLWEIHAFRQLLGYNLADTDADSIVKKPRILLFKRTLTRLTAFPSILYDIIEQRVREMFSRIAEIDIFSDQDKALMSSYKAQVNKIRSADIVVGPHGAGFHHILHARSRTAFVSWRGRTNSDIYQFLTLATNLRFSHLLWRYDLDDLIRQIAEQVFGIIKTRPPYMHSKSDITSPVRIGVIFSISILKKDDLKLFLDALWTYYENRLLLDLFIFLDEKLDTEYNVLVDYIRMQNFTNIFVNKIQSLPKWIQKKGSQINAQIKNNLATAGSVSCDVRTIYGPMFRDVVTKMRPNVHYTHWGFATVHTFLGNLSNFVFEDTLIQNDILMFADPKTLSGGSLSFAQSMFTLIRDFPDNRQLHRVLNDPLAFSTDPANDSCYLLNSVLTQQGEKSKHSKNMYTVHIQTTAFDDHERSKGFNNFPTYLQKSVSGKKFKALARISSTNTKETEKVVSRFKLDSIDWPWYDGQPTSVATFLNETAETDQRGYNIRAERRYSSGKWVTKFERSNNYVFFRELLKEVSVLTVDFDAPKVVISPLNSDNGFFDSDGSVIDSIYMDQLKNKHRITPYVDD